MATSINITANVEQLKSALDGLKKDAESTAKTLGDALKQSPAGGVHKSYAEREREREIDHIKLSASLRKRVDEDQARRIAAAYKNMGARNPWATQFSGVQDYLDRGRSVLGARDYSRTRGQLDQYIERYTGMSNGRAAFLRRFGPAAGAVGGMVGGMLGGGGGGLGSMGGMVGGGLGSLVGGGVGKLAGMGGGLGMLGMLGGPLGMLVGGIAGAALGGIGRKLDKAMTDVLDEGMKSSSLTRMFAGSGESYKNIKDYSRGAASGMDVSYVDSAAHAADYARIAALRSPSDLMGSLKDAYGYGRGMGVGQGAGVSFMATLRGTGAASDEKAAKRIGLEVASAIQRGGLGPQANEVLTAIKNFATSSTQDTFRAPDTSAFANLMAAGTSAGVAGLHAGSMASMMNQVDAAIKQGGMKGLASQTVTYDALTRLHPDMDVYDAKRLQEGGIFGTAAKAFGTDSVVVKRAEEQLKRAQAAGDQAGILSAQNDLAKYHGFATDKNASVSNLTAEIERIKSMGGTTSQIDAQLAGHFGISQDQSTAIQLSHSRLSGSGGIEARIRAAGLDPDNLNAQAINDIAGVAGMSGGELQKYKNQMLAGDGFKKLSEGDRKKLEGENDDTKLQNVLMQLLNQNGGRLSVEEKMAQTQTDINNAAMRMVDKLTDIRSGVLSLVGHFIKKTAGEIKAEEEAQAQAQHKEYMNDKIQKLGQNEKIVKSDQSDRVKEILNEHWGNALKRREEGDNAGYKRELDYIDSTISYLESGKIQASQLGLTKTEREKKLAEYNAQQSAKTGGMPVSAPARAVSAPARAVSAPAMAKGGPLSDKIKQAMDFYIGMGYSKEQAAGIVANLQNESGMNHLAVGDGGKAIGMAQWHPDRQANYKKAFGKDLRNATPLEQLGFVPYEMIWGTERKAGRLLSGAQTPEDSAAIMSDHYERPADFWGSKKRKRQKDARYIYDNYPDTNFPVGVTPIPAGGAGQQVGGQIKADLHVMVTDEKGRPRDDVKAKLGPVSYQPAPAGAHAIG